MKGPMALTPLTFKESIKRKRIISCKHCGKDVCIGDKYISVNYSDGFSRIGFGGFHPECWEKFQLINNNNP